MPRQLRANRPTWVKLWRGATFRALAALAADVDRATLAALLDNSGELSVGELVAACRAIGKE